ncbi:hypothetical protein [Alkalibacter mobilis]|uniref:hypothetical protein n=1 Tax=Alkalibacter mobilis TaxID=2787712 RepID=UPI00189EC420|nr:hypothetical protein [Alkalibacter mobilis]MBF7097036.1 hypothetical protein [Alkalibacter mobilis]
MIGHENCSCTCSEHDHKPSKISVTTHDMSIVGSYRFKIDSSYIEGEKLLEIVLKKIASDVKSSGGIVGHIKAHLSSSGNGCLISITDEETDKRYTDLENCFVEGVAIVFGITTKELEDILIKNID